MAEKNEVKDAYPPQKVKKPPKYLYFDKNVSFVSKTLLTSRIHPKTWEAQIMGISLYLQNSQKKLNCSS